MKLKEISYIHAEAYAAGELKHGTLALIVEGIPVIALATQKSVYEKMCIRDRHDAYKSGALEEVFGSGTAAVISPVGELCYKGEKMVIGGGKTGPFAQKMFDYITGLQSGTEKDTFGFLEEVAKL